MSAGVRWHEPPLALITPAELPAVDDYMARTGTSGFVLMERAGAAIAAAATSLAPAARRVTVFAGPTNNGGDSLCAARVLAAAGYDVVVALHGERDALDGDRKRAAMAWSGRLVAATPAALVGAELIVDGLYGGGQREVLTDDEARMVEAINASGLQILSVDFPSGINGASGALLGTAVRADRTITFVCLKPGHLLMPGRAHCGSVLVDPIGVPDAVLDHMRPTTFHNRPALWSAALAQYDRVRSGEYQCIPTDREAHAADVAERLAEAQARGRPAILVTAERDLRRLFPQITGSKLERTRRAAGRCGAVVAVLGWDVVVAAPDGRVAIAGNGGPDSDTVVDCRAVAAVAGQLTSLGIPGFEAATAAAWARGEVHAGSAAALSVAIAKVLRPWGGIALRDILAQESSPPSLRARQ